MTSKKPTLRQRLRGQAANDLDGILETVRLEVGRLVNKKTKAISAVEVMRLASGSRTKSLFDKAVTAMVDERERDLLKLYNDQTTLPLESKDAKAKM